MTILVVIACIALVIRALGPSRAQPDAAWRWLWMPVGAAALQISLNIHWVRATDDSRVAVLWASYLLIGLWLIKECTLQTGMLRRSFGLVVLGWLCNVTAALANGAMPVSQWALRAIGGNAASLDHGNLYKHVVATPSTFAPWLGDVLPLPFPIVRNVISVGDVLMLIGIAWAIQVVPLSGVHARERSVKAVPLAP